MKNKVWMARISAIAGLFVTGGAALGIVPQKYQETAAAVAALIISLCAVLPPVHANAEGQ